MTVAEQESRWKPYPAYKDSGVEWLGEIPEEWEVASVKQIAKQGYGTFTDGDWVESPYITDDGIRLIQTGNIGIGAYREQGFRYISYETFEELGCTEVTPGDILVCRLADPVGRACLAPNLGCSMITSVDVCIIKPNREQYDSRYYVWFMSSKPYLSWAQAICRGGTRDRISRSMLGNISVLLPPLPEQKAIATFLDRKTSQIDELIEKKERLIDLLQEKRQALITHTVTKGLDPDAPMKDSGIEWLGEIPEGWDAIHLRYISQIQPSNVNKKSDDDEPGVRLCNYTDVYYNELIHSELDFMKATASHEQIRKFALKRGDILITKDSEDRMDIAVPAYVPRRYERVLCGYHLSQIRPHQDTVYSKYLFRAFAADGVSDQFGIAAHGITRYGLSVLSIKNAVFPLPPLPEQKAIADYLDDKTSQIDELIEKTEQTIECLKEYRTALITAAVTGQIDVRDEVREEEVG